LPRVSFAAVAAVLAIASTNANAADKVTIGFLGTMSGPSAALGLDQLAGFKLALQAHNGKLGGLPVDLVTADDELKPDLGVLAAKKFVEASNADIVVGTTFSNVLMAVAKPVTQAGAFLISPNAGPSPLAGAQCSPNFFAVAFENSDLYTPVGQYLTNKGVKRAFVLAPNYQAGRDAVAGFKRTFKGEIVNEVYTGLTQLDYASELASIAAAAPEAVFVFYPGGLAINFVKQYAQAGLKGRIPLYSSFPIADETVRGAEGDAAVGITVSDNWAPDRAGPATQTFIEAFRKANNRMPSEFAMYAHDVAELIDSAIGAVKGNLADKDGFRAALKAAKFATLRESFAFNNNHFPIQDWYIREVVKGPDGATTMVTREKIFTAKADDYGKDCPMK
jgi:branched-chain amino acid transport system substrate-binding protein